MDAQNKISFQTPVSETSVSITEIIAESDREMEQRWDMNDPGNQNRWRQRKAYTRSIATKR